MSAVKTEKNDYKVAGIGQVESFGTTRKQILKLHKEAEPGTNRDDAHYEVELWNNSIEKFDLAENFEVGDSVEVVLYVNGKYKQTPTGKRYSNPLALYSIVKM